MDRDGCEAFEYIVKKPSHQKICFGSGTERRYYDNELTVQTMANPMSYNTEKYKNISSILNKPSSKRGVGFLASTSRTAGFLYDVMPNAKPGRPSKHTKKITKIVPKAITLEAPPPEVAPKIIAQSAAPFCKSEKRFSCVINDNPGPGTYEPKAKKCRKLKTIVENGKYKLPVVTQCMCVGVIEDECYKCKKLCQNDYWHLNHKQYLCHPCMVEEHILHETFDKKTLKNFAKIRNCSFMHHHENTHAAIRLLTQNKIDKKNHLESYLDLFLKT